MVKKHKGKTGKGKWIITAILLYATVYVHACEQPETGKKRQSWFSIAVTDQDERALLNNLKIVPYPHSDDQITLGHFYQQLNYGDQLAANWHISSVVTVLHSRYFRFGFSIDQADYAPMHDRLWSTDMSYRAGIRLDQAYNNNDILYFRFSLASGSYFAGVAFNAGYSGQIDAATRLYVDVQGLEFGPDKLCFSLATGLVRSFVRHQLTVQPYYFASQKRKVNLIIADKLTVGKRNNYLEAKFVTGYFPNPNTFINYDHINDKRYRFSCEGGLGILKNKLRILSVFGVEYIKNSVSYSRNRYFQLGIQFNL